MPTFEVTQRGYANLFAKAQVRPDRQGEADEHAGEIISLRPRYAAIETDTGVPWFWTGLAHTRESTRNFNTYLGNGQPLNRRTTLVPAGRGPFPTFEAGAIDALQYHDLHEVRDWSLARVLYELERWNGFGYYGKNVNAPYLWAWTTLYTSGKYVADHVFSRSAVDTQPGCAAILKSLIRLDADVASRLGFAPAPPDDDEPDDLARLQEIANELTAIANRLKGQS